MRAGKRSRAGVLWRCLLVAMFLGLFVPTQVALGGRQASAKQNATAQVPSTKTVNLELVFDSSGSMAEDLGGETKIDAAKSVLNDVIDSIPERPGVNVGFR